MESTNSNSTPTLRDTPQQTTTHPARRENAAETPATESKPTEPAPRAADPQPAPDESKSRLDPNSPSRKEILLGLAIMAAWLFLLGVGTIYSSTVYGDRLVKLRLGASEVIYQTPWFFTLFLLTYTMTNTLMLCVLAAALGQAGRRDRIDDDTQGVQSRPGQYFGAMVRGFMTYLFVVSGSVVIANKTFDSPTRQDYLTFATTVSVLGFLAGFNPGVFVRFMNGVQRSVQPRDNVAPAQTKKTGGDESKSTNPMS